jgi:hypothetical protein
MVIHDHRQTQLFISGLFHVFGAHRRAKRREQSKADGKSTDFAQKITPARIMPQRGLFIRCFSFLF